MTADNKREGQRIARNLGISEHDGIGTLTPPRQAIKARPQQQQQLESQKPQTKKRETSVKTVMEISMEQLMGEIQSTPITRLGGTALTRATPETKPQYPRGRSNRSATKVLIHSLRLDVCLLIFCTRNSQRYATVVTDRTIRTHHRPSAHWCLKSNGLHHLYILFRDCFKGVSR